MEDGKQKGCRICELLGFSVDRYVGQALAKLEEGDPKKLTGPREYERRLQICGRCPEKLPDGSCRMCGCYGSLAGKTEGEPVSVPESMDGGEI